MLKREQNIYIKFLHINEIKSRAPEFINGVAMTPKEMKNNALYATLGTIAFFLVLLILIRVVGI